MRNNITNKNQTKTGVNTFYETTYIKTRTAELARLLIDVNTHKHILEKQLNSVNKQIEAIKEHLEDLGGCTNVKK